MDERVHETAVLCEAGKTSYMLSHIQEIKELVSDTQRVKESESELETQEIQELVFSLGC